jgi:hypothetical protein
MQTKLVRITPKLAAEWLDANHNNRPLNRAYVEELSRLIADGKFRTTHQGIAFDQRDRLRDGQHRLTAVVRTGIAVDMLVTTGLTEEELQAIDDGRRRTAQQVLSMSGQGFASNFATAVAREMLVGGHHLRDGAKRLKPGRQDLIDFFLRHREAVKYAEHHLRNHLSGLALGYVGAVIARAFYNVERPKLDRFAEVLATGYAREGDEPIIRLRNYILRARREQRRGFVLRDDIYAKTERTLRDWVDETPSRNLIGAREELFPIPGDDRQGK